MKMLFIDIDGTLFSHSTYAVPKSASDALERTHQLGNKAVIATGRAFFMSEPVAEMVAHDACVFCNGAGIYADGRLVYEKTVSDALIRDTIMLAEKTHAGMNMQGIDNCWMNETCEAFMRPYLKAEGRKFYSDRSLPLKAYRGEKIYKIDIFYNSDTDISLFEEELSSQLTYVKMLSVHDNSSRGGELTMRGVSKGSAVEKYVELVSGRMDDTYAFGDSMNDLEMLKRAHTAIAMGNASDQLKRQADYVTDDIDHDGLFNAMKHFHLI